MRRVINTADAYQSKSPLSQAVVEGGFVFVSGMTAVDRNGRTVGNDISTQTRQVMENLRIVLEASGTSMKRVVRTTVFFTLRDDYAGLDEVYKQYFPGDPPSRSAIVVVGLVRPELLVEIDAIASVGSGDD
jgi:2-iminobutanoate/2-iminopropanoate deaminase